MQPVSSQSITSTNNDQAEDFLHNLALENVVWTRSDWRNNNSTLTERAYVIDMTDVKYTPSQIFRSLFEHNQNNEKRRLVAVPVAGWKNEEIEEYGKSSCMSCFSSSGRKQRLVTEYAQSFSLSPMTTAKNADLILRVSKAAQEMEVFKEGEEIFFCVSAGVRITDADEYLLKLGLALPPNMPTLHVASLVGAAANGCYGPGRDYGPMTTNIVEMKVINALGQPMILSEKDNAKIFRVLRDCHMGAGCFVSEITLKNIEPKFRMRRQHTLYTDVPELKKEMLRENRIKEEHFIAMYIPVDIQSKGDHGQRLRITTINRTDQSPTKETKTQEQQDICDYLSLITTEAGEPLIDLIVKSKELRQFFPFIIKAAGLKTFGTKKETTEIDWSASIVHILRTYTDLPICVINWLIQVDGPDEARDALVGLLEKTEELLKEYAKDDQYPLLNAFARYLKGVYYPKGEGGIAPTAVDKENQRILSFEFVTYAPLEQTKAFKELVNAVITFLTDKGLKFQYHPGKNWPEQVSTLKKMFNDKIGKQRLNNFKEAIYELHGGEKNILYSPLLTLQKKEFIGFSSPVKIIEKSKKGEVKKSKEKSAVSSLSRGQEQQALQRIIQLAQEEDNQEVVEKALAVLAKPVVI